MARLTSSRRNDRSHSSKTYYTCLGDAVLCAVVVVVVVVVIVVARSGEPSKALYFIASGTVGVIRVSKACLVVVVVFVVGGPKL